MKKLLSFLFFFLLLCYIPKPQYYDLNQLIIIDSIDVICHDYEYEIVFYEIIPEKDDSITYKHKQYSFHNSDLNVIKKEIDSSHFYYHSVKSLSTNCSDVSFFIHSFHVDPKIVTLD